MTIYIEIFLFQNLIINFCLLRLVKITLKAKSTFFSLFLSSLAGAGFSVFGAVFISSNLIMNILKFVCALIMLVLAFKQTVRQFCASLILFFMFTYAVGGAIVGLSSNSYLTTFGMITTSRFSLSLVCFVVIVLTYIFELVLNGLAYRVKSNGLICELVLKLKNKEVKINAFMDTGNLLKFNEKPVIVLDLKTYLKLTNTDLINFLLKQSEQISTDTVAGENRLKLFTIDSVMVKMKNKTINLKNQYVAINSTGAFKNLNYQALINPMML